MKICSGCKQNKSESSFSPSSRYTSGLASACRDCNRASGLKSYYKNHEINKIKGKERQKLNPDRVKNTHLLRKFGITLIEYRAKLKAQNGVCFICLKAETAVIKGKLSDLSVDHNHDTLRVRDLLCRNCNTALGLLKENFDSALRLAKYLQHHNNVV